MRENVRLTGNQDFDLIAENGPDGVAGDALVDARVLPAHRLDLVDGLRRKLRLEQSVLHPSILGLRVTLTDKQKSSLNIEKKKKTDFFHQFRP